MLLIKWLLLIFFLHVCSKEKYYNPPPPLLCLFISWGLVDFWSNRLRMVGEEGGSRHRVTHHNFAFHKLKNLSKQKAKRKPTEHSVTSLKLIQATRGQLWLAVQFNKLFSQISVYSRFTIKDFSSSCFTECTSIRIHRMVFQYIMIHGGLAKRRITRSQK